MSSTARMPRAVGTRGKAGKLAFYPAYSSLDPAEESPAKTLVSAYPSLEILDSVACPTASPITPVRKSWLRPVPPLDRDKLEKLARDTIDAGPLPPYRPPQPSPKVRRWEPDPAPTLTRGKIKTARAELGLRGVPVLREPKVSRSGEEGWRGRTHSFKGGGMLPWKGRLVDAAIRDADVDADVDKILMRPLTLRYRTEHGWRNYSPDMLMIKRRQPWLITCHWENTANSPHLKDLWQQIGTAAADLGLGFEVLTERHIEREPRFLNVEEIWRARFDPPVDADTARRVVEAAIREPLTISKLLEAAGVTRDTILKLLLHGPLKIDLDTDIDTAVVALRSESL